MKRVVVQEPGGPDVIEIEEVDSPRPGEGEVAVRHEAIGLNFIDTYHRRGLYPLPAPFGLGLEASGEIAAVGPGVRDVSVGDRVVYVAGPPGAYAEQRIVPAERVVTLPETVAVRDAAAGFLRGMTAEYLLHRAASVGEGNVILLHAAAGGLGLLMCGWASALGATVIGTVSTPKKAERARAAGCAHPVLRGEAAFEDVVTEVTDGRGADVVYDGVGGEAFERSLKVLRRRGTLVNYGSAAGPARAVAPRELSAAGSVFLTGASLMDYVATRDDLLMSAGRFFEAVGKGWIAPGVEREYPLAEAAQAHADLEGGETTGAAILVP